MSPEQMLNARARPRAMIDAAKNRGVDTRRLSRATACGTSAPRTVYALYQEKMRRNNALDFGDLLLCTVRLFEEHPDVLDRYRERFLHVLVDEYQDTNAVQYRLTNLLASRHRNLCVVGDEDQSIYRWRGAEIGNILDFERDYPDAVVIRLEQNYRSTGTILDAAGAVVAQNTQRKGKTLWTDESPRRQDHPGVSSTTRSTKPATSPPRSAAYDQAGRSLRQIAVFYRTNAQSRARGRSAGAPAHPVRHGRRRQVLRARRGEGRARVPAGAGRTRPTRVAAKRIINVPARGIGSVDGRAHRDARNRGRRLPAGLPPGARARVS